MSDLTNEQQIRVVALENAVKHQAKNGWQGPDQVLDLALSFEHYLHTGETLLEHG